MGGSPSRSSRVDVLAAVFGADPNDAQWSRLAEVYLKMLDIKASMAVSRTEEITPAIAEIIAAGDQVLVLVEKALRRTEFDSVGMSGRGKGGKMIGPNGQVITNRGIDFATDEEFWDDDTNKDTRDKIIELEHRLYELHLMNTSQPNITLDNQHDSDIAKDPVSARARMVFLVSQRAKLYAKLGISKPLPYSKDEDLDYALQSADENTDDVVDYYPYLSKKELREAVARLSKRIQMIQRYVETKGKTDLDQKELDDEDFPGEFNEFYNFDGRIATLRGYIDAANAILEPASSPSKTETVLIKAAPVKRTPKSSASSKKISWTHAYAKVDITVKNDATGERRVETINIKFWTIRQYRHYVITPPGEYRELFPYISEYVTRTFEGYSFDRSVKEKKYIEIKEGRGFTPLAILVEQDGEVSLGTIKRVTLAVASSSSPQVDLVTKDFESEAAMETSRAQGFKDVLPEDQGIVVHIIDWKTGTGRQLPYNATI